jgi:hypothetical protein
MRKEDIEKAPSFGYGASKGVFCYGHKLNDAKCDYHDAVSLETADILLPACSCICLKLQILNLNALTD